MPKNRRSADRPQGRERRSFPRYPAIDNTAQVSWRQGDAVETTAAQLMDVSRMGMLVLADAEPPPGLPVLIRLVEPARTAWVEARVAESRPTCLGPFQLRLACPNGAPKGFFALASARDEALN